MCVTINGAFPGDSVVRSLPAKQETPVLGWEDSLEKEKATQSKILCWEIPWTEQPGGLYIVHGVSKSQPPLGEQQL